MYTQLPEDIKHLWQKSIRAKDTGPEPHRLSYIDVKERTAVCSVCGKTDIAGKDDKWVCRTRIREHRRRSQKKYWDERREAKIKWKKENGLPSGNDYRRFVKPICERCGFVAIKMAQMDVHHKDRDRSNNHVSNLISLCANCHRLEHADDKKLSAVIPIKNPDNIEDSASGLDLKSAKVEATIVIGYERSPLLKSNGKIF